MLLLFNGTVYPCNIDSALSITNTEYNEYIYDLYINHAKHKNYIYFLTDKSENIYINECSYRTLIPSKYVFEEFLINDAIFYKIPDDRNFLIELSPESYTISFIFSASDFPSNDIYLKSKNQIHHTDAPSFGTYLNYDISFQQNNFRDQVHYGALGEWVVYSPYGFLRNSSLANNFDSKKIIRLESTWKKDLPKSMLSWNFGDLISGNDIWSNSVRLGGIQYQSNFQTQPYFITYPLPGYKGEAVIPSQLEFYLNDNLRLNQSVQPGPFSINELPAITGYNEVIVQATDLMGRAQIAVIPFYVSTYLLKPGLSSFSYDLGFIRKNFGINSNDYGRFAAIGTHYYGVTESWTTGGHFEFLSNQQTFGLSNINKLGYWGILHTAYSVSLNDKKPGAQLLLRFDRQSQNFSYGFQGISNTKNYRQIDTYINKLPENYSILVFGGYNHLTLGGININYAHQKNRDAEDMTIFLVSYNKNIFKKFYLYCSYVQRNTTITRREYQLSIIWSPKTNYTTSITSSINEDHLNNRIMFQKTPPLDTGYGYRAYLEKGKDVNGLIDFIYKNRYGEYSAKYSKYYNTDNVELNTRGAIVSDGRSILFSKTIFDSFAIVNTSGVPNIKIYEGNNPMGSTNKNGYLVVPQLRAYQNNDINIKLNELPISLETEKSEMNVIPYARSGYHLNFDLYQPNNFVFNLVDDNGIPLGAGSSVEIENQNTTYPIGYQGMVFIQTKGAHQILRGRAIYNDKTCFFEVNIKNTNKNEIINDLGILSCQK